MPVISLTCKEKSLPGFCGWTMTMVDSRKSSSFVDIWQRCLNYFGFE